MSARDVKHCDAFLDEYAGRVAAQIPGLEALTERSVDAVRWVRTLVCEECGQVWEERFEERGHGEVPMVRKCPPPELPVWL